MSKYDDAFPHPGHDKISECGLNKREYAAIQIMAGFAADPETSDYIVESLAESAVKWADALFAELDK